MPTNCLNEVKWSNLIDNRFIYEGDENQTIRLECTDGASRAMSIKGPTQMNVPEVTRIVTCYLEQISDILVHRRAPWTAPTWSLTVLQDQLPFTWKSQAQVAN